MADHAVQFVTVLIGIAVAGIALRTRRTNPSWFEALKRFGLLSFAVMTVVASIVNESRLLVRAEQAEIAYRLQSKGYETVEGMITHLASADKFWKTDPVPTFRVGESEFEFGVYSQNRRLLTADDGGPLQDRQFVSIWHHEGLILRIYADRR